MTAKKGAASVDMGIYDPSFSPQEAAKLRALENTVCELIIKRMVTTDRPVWQLCQDDHGRRWARLSTVTRKDGIVDIPCERLLTITEPEFRDLMADWIDFPKTHHRCC